MPLTLINQRHTIANQRVASNPPAQVANPSFGVAQSAQASAVTTSHTHNAPNQLAESSQSMASSTTTNGTVNDEYLIGFAKILVRSPSAIMKY